MATGRAPRTPERDRFILQSTPLAEAEAKEKILFRNQTAIMRMVVSVHKCPRGFRSRLGYHATLYLKMEDDVERYVGYIIAWHVSKPTGVSPNTDPRYYMDDWYHRRGKDYDRDSRLLASCIRAIIEPGSYDGENYDQVLDEGKRNQLRDGGNEFMFIQTIYVKWRENPEDEDSEVGNHELSLPITMLTSIS
jgi:hypothetical protein